VVYFSEKWAGEWTVALGEVGRILMVGQRTSKAMEKSPQALEIARNGDRK